MKALHPVTARISRSPTEVWPLLVMDREDLVTYSRGMEAALRVTGPTPRDRVLGMLRGLHLTDEEAEAVIDLGLAQGFLTREGTSLVAPTAA